MPGTIEPQKWLLPDVLFEFAAAGDFDLVREIIDVFLTDTEEKVDSLQKAFLASDLIGAQRIAHSLKGAARQLDIVQVADGAERLEHSPPELDSAAFCSFVRAILERWPRRNSR